MGFIPPCSSKGGRTMRQRAIRTNFTETLEHDITSNLLKVYKRADSDTLIEGYEWYERAHNIARSLANVYETDIDTVCGIIAATSPQQTWSTNVAITTTILRTGKADNPYICGDQVQKVRRLLNGDKPTNVLGGRKVRSFYHNVRFPNRVGHVCIDRHAASAAIGRPLGQSYRGLERVGTYQTIAACYRNLARRLDILPQALQAVIWVQWRQEEADKYAEKDKLLDEFLTA